MNNNPQDPFQKAQHTALSLLARRCHSREEIRRKLAVRGFETGVIEQVLTACEQCHYIDDETAADCFIKELIRRQMGVLRIRESMKARGFSGDLIRRMIDTHHLQVREMKMAEGAVKKKKAALIREKDTRKRKEKLVRFLRSRGFQSSTISAVLDGFEKK